MKCNKKRNMENCEEKKKRKGERRGTKTMKNVVKEKREKR